MKSFTLRQLSVSVLMALGLACSANLYADNPNSPVEISDEPPAPGGYTPVQLMWLFDDSGSMRWRHAPDNLGLIPNACWVDVPGVNGGGSICQGSGCVDIKQCGFPYPNPYFDPDSFADADAATQILKAVQLLPPPLEATGFNSMAYNPAYTYKPPVYVDENGAEKSLPEMDATSTNNWTQVGWPDQNAKDANGNVSPFERPDGVPVDLDFREFTDPSLYANDRAFINARSYDSAQANSLTMRYMAGADPDTARQNQQEIYKHALFKEKLVDGKWVTQDMPIPLHYFITSVKWCDTLQTSAHSDGVEWLESASATDANGNSACQDNFSQDHPYPYYYYPNGKLFKVTNGDGSVSDMSDHTRFPAFRVIVLDYDSDSTDPATAPAIDYSVVQKSADGFDVAVWKTRSYADELVNYANWYAYYSTRGAALRTTASFALDGIALKPERWLDIGVTNLNGSASSIADAFKSMQRVQSEKDKYGIFQKLLGNAFSDGVDNLATPLKTGLREVRDAFQQTPLLGCERNYVVALSDGSWNDQTTTGDLDASVKGLPKTPTEIKVLGRFLANNTLWPYPIHEGEAVADTLADAATYDWITPLLSPDQNLSVLSSQDPATWSHVNTIGLAYGAIGTLPFFYTTSPMSQLDVLKAIGDSSVTPNALSWPTPVANDPTAADDLWHATLNGFGSFTSSLDPSSYETAIENGSNAYQQGLSGINNRAGTSSALGLPDDRDGSRIYVSLYLPDWAGDVRYYSVPGDESQDATLGNYTWSAGADLQQRLIDVAPGATPWDDRKVFTANVDLNVKAGVDFTAAALPQNDLAALCVNPADSTKSLCGVNNADAQKLVDYLRGDPSNEYNNDNLHPNSGIYRSRSGRLGDFIHAAPVVSDPSTKILSGKWLFNYKDTGYLPVNDQDTSAFVVKIANRPTVIYAAGNDGMLHAFEDTGDAKGGKELWAFIPPELFRANYGIQSLAYLPGADDKTSWKHRYYVDATPRDFDVDLAAGKDAGSSKTTPDAPDWRTMLVGGMGKGGDAYYALDITDPETVSASSLYMWSFTDPNMGYTYGRPVIGKTLNAAWNISDAKDGALSQKWVAFLPSGIDNSGECKLQSGDVCNRFQSSGDGVGRLFIVDLKTGKKLAEISTGVGSKTQPSGLAYINGYVKNSFDQTVTEVYGGDQLGNLWRFDLNNADESKWKAVKIAEFTDPSGLPQPVNTEPRMVVSDDASGNSVRWIAVGTGRFFDDKDIYDASTGRYPALRQSFYAIKDGNETQTDTSGVVASRANLAVLSGAAGNATVASAADKRGWVDDFDTGYQVYTNPDSVMNVIIYSANKYIPPEDNAADDKARCANSVYDSLSFARAIGTGASLLPSGKESVPFNFGIATSHIVIKNGSYYALFSSDTVPPHVPRFQLPQGTTPGQGGPHTPLKSSIRYIFLGQ